MKLIKGNGGSYETQALVRRVCDLADEKRRATAERETKHRGIASLPDASVNGQSVEIIEPQIWTPRPSGRTSFAPVSRVDHPPVLELPRWCTIYDGEMSLARYLWRNGEYVYDESIELTPAQKRRYSPENAFAVPNGFCAARECCGICGKWTPGYAVGGVFCSRCHPVSVCFGRTTPDRYFQCRSSCGRTAFLEEKGFERMALVPGRSRGNFGTSI